MVSFRHRCTFSTLQTQRVKSVDIRRETLPEYDIPYVYPMASNIPDRYDMEAGRGNIQVPKVKTKFSSCPHTQSSSANNGTPLPGTKVLHFQLVDGEWPSSSWHLVYTEYTYVYMYGPISS